MSKVCVKRHNDSNLIISEKQQIPKSCYFGFFFSSSGSLDISNRGGLRRLQHLFWTESKGTVFAEIVFRQGHCLPFCCCFPSYALEGKKSRTRFKDKNYTDTFDTESNTSLQWSNSGLLFFFVINPSLAIWAQTTHACFSGEDGISLVLEERATKGLGVSTYWKGKAVAGLFYKLKH